jgi:glycine dehydrogenase subunit 1
MPYVANTDQNRKEMLQKIGVGSFEELLKDIPEELRLKKPLNLPKGLSELEVTKLLRELSEQNRSSDEYINFLGAGSYDHFIPAAVDQIISRSEFYTAYTPYQAEASQGTLQSIYEFQSLICQLTEMELANASLYDGGSALAEACLLAHYHTEKNKILIPENLHPFYKKVLKTYVAGRGLKLVEIAHIDGQIRASAVKEKIDEQTAAVVVQNPNFLGILEEDIEEIEKLTHSSGALLIMVCDPISLGILKTPGEYNADIVVGEGQSLGNRMNFGGPYLGYFACKKEYLRKLPGRLIGVTTDNRGQRGFVMTLQTREQHIRREKATSNICTNQGLMALAATVYLSLLGKQGIKQVAELCLQKAHYALERIESETGFKRKFSAPFFKEFVLESPIAPKKVVKVGLKQNLLAGLDLSQFKIGLDNGLLVAVTEKRSKFEIDALVSFFKIQSQPVSKIKSESKDEVTV